MKTSLVTKERSNYIYFVTVNKYKIHTTKVRKSFFRAKKRRQAVADLLLWEVEENVGFVLPSRESIRNPRSNNSTPLESPFVTIGNTPSASDRSTNSHKSRTPQFKRSNEQTYKHELQDLYNLIQCNLLTQNRNIQDNLDAIDTLFLSMSQATKKLPILEQIEIKYNIQRMVYQAEIRYYKSEEIQKSLKAPIASQCNPKSLTVNSTSTTCVTKSPIHMPSSPRHVHSPGNTSKSVTVCPIALDSTPTSPTYNPSSPTSYNNPASPGYIPRSASSSPKHFHCQRFEPTLDFTHYSPISCGKSPIYMPTSPTYRSGSPTQLHLQKRVPTPEYTSTSPTYYGKSPISIPTSPSYRPTSPT